MRLAKAIGFAAMAALVAMAFLGAQAASAEKPTVLCLTHTLLECPEEQQLTNTLVHAVLTEGPYGNVGEMLNSTATILCLNVLATPLVLELGEPLTLHTDAGEHRITYEGCGSSSTHNNCEIEETEGALFLVLKTGLDHGTLTVDGGKTYMHCEHVTIFNLTIDCTYSADGLEFLVGEQKLHADHTGVLLEEGGTFCPAETELDGLIEALEIGAGTLDYTALCKVHTSPCAEKNQAESVKMSSTKASVFYNPVANVECESSSLAATALAPTEAQKLDLTELSWKGCHTQGAADNCTVTSKGSPSLDVKGTALNVGEATTLGLEVAVECLILDLIELDCVYGSKVSLPVEGALYKEGAGNGRLTASKVELAKIKGEGHCPESVKWDASYEFSEHLYVVPWTTEVTGGSVYILK